MLVAGGCNRLLQQEATTIYKSGGHRSCLWQEAVIDCGSRRPQQYLCQEAALVACGRRPAREPMQPLAKQISFLPWGQNIYFSPISHPCSQAKYVRQLTAAVT